MRAPVLALVFALSAAGVSADPAVREALDLELDGRLGEALDRYRAALADPALVHDEGVTQELTIQVLSKAAHLCVDLGYGEEASDFAARLAASKNLLALQKAGEVRARLARVKNQYPERPAWLKSAAYQPSAADVLGVAVQDSVRIQLGAFKDWSNALTLIDMLREKGWSPLTDVKSSSGGEKLYAVYVVSRQPAQDRARLTAQGLLDR